MSSDAMSDDLGTSGTSALQTDDSSTTAAGNGAGATTGTPQPQVGQAGRLSRHQSSASSTSRRSSTAHRSPSLSAQPDPYMPQRFSNSQQEKQDILNAMEFEEEALVNNLSRKLEKLRAEKFELESTLEMEQEALVNKLQRRLSELLNQQQLQQALGLNSSASSSIGSPVNQDTALPTMPGPNLAPLFSTSDPSNPSTALLLDALQTENTSLRERLADVESAASRTEKVNELYRLELIHLRERAGLDVADLTGTTYPASSSRQSREPNVRGASNGSTGAIRIPGVSNSPPAAHARGLSKSSYSPSISSALSMSTPYSSSPATHVTTPSTSYTTPHAPASTPVGHAHSLAHAHGGTTAVSSSASTPYGSVTSSSSGAEHSNGYSGAYRVPPPSMASSLGISDGTDNNGPASFAAARPLAASPIQEANESGQNSRSESPQSSRLGTTYSPESLQRRLSASRNGARVAETGFLKRRTASGNTPSAGSGGSPASSAN